MGLSITGIINPDGSIQAGQGFRCQKAGSGFYAIEFDIPFEKPPVAVCTLCGSSDSITNRSVSIVSIAAFQVVCATASIESPEDASFKFIVLGNPQQSVADGDGWIS